MQYHRVDTQDILAGSASGNGQMYDTVMVAGSVGIKATSSRDTLDTVQPESGWWMYERKTNEKVNDKVPS